MCGGELVCCGGGASRCFQQYHELNVSPSLPCPAPRAAVSEKHLVRVLGYMQQPLALVMEYCEGRPVADKPNLQVGACRWWCGAGVGGQAGRQAGGGVVGGTATCAVCATSSNAEVWVDCHSVNVWIHSQVPPPPPLLLAVAAALPLGPWRDFPAGLAAGRGRRGGGGAGAPALPVGESQR